MEHHAEVYFRKTIAVASVLHDVLDLWHWTGLSNNMSIEVSVVRCKSDSVIFLRRWKAWRAPFAAAVSPAWDAVIDHLIDFFCVHLFMSERDGIRSLEERFGIRCEFNCELFVWVSTQLAVEEDFAAFECLFEFVLLRLSKVCLFSSDLSRRYFSTCLLEHFRLVEFVLLDVFVFFALHVCFLAEPFCEHRFRIGSNVDDIHQHGVRVTTGWFHCHTVIAPLNSISVEAKLDSGFCQKVSAECDVVST